PPKEVADQEFLERDAAALADLKCETDVLEVDSCHAWLFPPCTGDAVGRISNPSGRIGNPSYSWKISRRCKRASVKLAARLSTSTVALAIPKVSQSGYRPFRIGSRTSSRNAASGLYWAIHWRLIFSSMVRL